MNILYQGHVHSKTLHVNKVTDKVYFSKSAGSPMIIILPLFTLYVLKFCKLCIEYSETYLLNPLVSQYLIV